MVIGPTEVILIIVSVLLWLLPFAIIAILIRNYLRKRQTKQSRELQAEIELLKQQVTELERSQGSKDV